MKYYIVAQHDKGEEPVIYIDKPEGTWATWATITDPKLIDRHRPHSKEAAQVMCETGGHRFIVDEVDRKRLLIKWTLKRI